MDAFTSTNDSTANRYNIVCQVYYLIERLRMRHYCYDSDPIYASEWGIKREDFMKMVSDFYNPDLRPRDDKPLYGSRIQNSRKIYYAAGEPPVKTPNAPDAHKYRAKNAAEIKEDIHLSRMYDKGYGSGSVVRACDVSYARGSCEVARQLIANEKGTNVKDRDICAVYVYDNFNRKEPRLFGVGEILVDMSPETPQILEVCRSLGDNASRDQVVAFLRVLRWVHIDVPTRYEQLRIDVMPDYQGQYMNSYICMIGEIAIGLLKSRNQTAAETFKYLWHLYESREHPAQRWLNHVLGAAIIAADSFTMLPMLNEHELDLKPYALWAHEHKAARCLSQIAAPKFLERILREQTAQREMRSPKP